MPDDPNYLRMLDYMSKLNELIAAGEGDSEEADAIRDAMDAPWYALSEVDRERLRQFTTENPHA